MERSAKWKAHAAERARDAAARAAQRSAARKPDRVIVKATVRPISCSPKNSSAESVHT